MRCFRSLSIAVGCYKSSCNQLPLSKFVEISKDVSVEVLMFEDRPKRFLGRMIVTRPSSSHEPLNAVSLTELRYSTMRELASSIRMELCSLHCSSSDTNCLVKCSKDKLSSHVIINSKPKHSSRMLISGCTEIGKALSNRIYVVSDVSTALRDPWSKCLSTRSGGYDTVVVTLKSLGLILVAPRDFIVDATVLS